MMVNKIGENLARIRKENGVTQQQIADAFGNTCAWVSRIEHGHLDIPSSVMFLLCDVVGCTPNDIYGYENHERGKR